MSKLLIISSFVALKNKIHTNMLPNKGMKNLSELKNFFTISEKAFFLFTIHQLIMKIISENKQLMKWINLNPLSEAV